MLETTCLCMHNPSFCSQIVTEYSLFIDSIFSSKSTQRMGVVVGEEKNTSLFLFLALRARCCVLADVSEKNEKKNKATSVYRLD